MGARRRELPSGHVAAESVGADADRQDVRRVRDVGGAVHARWQHARLPVRPLQPGRDGRHPPAQHGRRRPVQGVPDAVR